MSDMQPKDSSRLSKAQELLGLTNTSLTTSDTVIIVVYQLPLTITRASGGGFDIKWATPSNAVSHTGLNLPTRCLWVGCISLEVNTEEEQELERRLLDDFGVVVVFLEPQLQKDFYQGFCRGYLRPIFHNQGSLAYATHPFAEHEWRAYHNVNRIFANKVMEVYEPGYMVWVHDYHLLLLPSCILRKHRTAHIGLFLHSPFPASDVFRTVAVREELLRAMLNTDLLGMMLFEYTRNFLTCCKRMLGLDYEFQRGGFLGIEYGGRHVMLQVSTFGVSPNLLSNQLVSNANNISELAPLRAALAPLREHAAAAGTKVVVLAGMDYLDRLKGVELKLRAWEALLNDYPKYRKNHVLVQICIGSRNQVKMGPDSDEYCNQLKQVVERINKTYPGAVYFENVSYMTAAARLQIWRETDVAVYSAIREAVNTWPLEYLVARDLAKQPAGALVLSEFSAFSRVLNGALSVNPFSQIHLVNALDSALQMKQEERNARARKDLLTITSHTMAEWGRRFVQDLKNLERKQEEDWQAMGFGLSTFRMVGMSRDFKPLDTEVVVEAYNNAKRRAILLDWGGTLTPADIGFYDHRETDAYAVPEDVLAVLRTLAADSKNHVMILSGLSRSKVETAFGSVPNLSLCVEHGFDFRLRDNKWQQLAPGVDTSWQEVAEAVMEMYVLRTNGSYVQKKGSSIAWNYQSSDPEFGVMQARELQEHLRGVLQPFPVVVRSGKGYVELCFKGVNKGAMAERLVDLCDAEASLDFVLCMGDDSTDELMFASLKDKVKGPKANLPANGLFTVTVGRKPSEASSYLNDHNEVIELLDMLANGGMSSIRPADMPNAGSMEAKFGGGGGGGGGGGLGGMRRNFSFLK